MDTREDDRRNAEWATTQSPGTLVQTIQCPSAICLAGDDAGYVTRDGGYVCSHCGELVRPDAVALWLGWQIAYAEHEVARLKTWRDEGPAAAQAFHEAQYPKIAFAAGHAASDDEAREASETGPETGTRP